MLAPLGGFPVWPTIMAVRSRCEPRAVDNSNWRGAAACGAAACGAAAL